jgi:DNA mismatch repair protein MutS2
LNDATFHKLDFDAIREVIATYCATGLGKSLARSMTPSVKTHVVREWLEQVGELAAAAEEHNYPPMGGVHDVREHVRASAFPAPLEADVLAHIAETLTATALLCTWFKQSGPVAPSLKSLAERIHDLSPISTAIHEAIDERGQVRDYASPRLGSIRSAIEEAKGRVRVVFDRILRHTGLTKLLQYSGATFHDDRFVLPLKAEENKEITQILRGLSQRVNVNAKAILGTLGAIAILDLIAGKCRYAKKRKCLCPRVDADGVLELHEARHPLLIELFDREVQEGRPRKEVVPIDVRLGEDFDALVITGPNTGGKTVTIKTVGLLALMNQCGVPVPVGEGSKMPVYSDIFIDIGDEQSLQQSLSTFSSHLATLLDILQKSGPRSLVLIDELGAGTDPDEGAAIGRAVIAELLRLKAKAIVTTHLSVLKAVAFTTPRVDNASVEFDPESLKPTYHLRLGEPGNSNALIIAKRLGMPARLVQLAKGFLDDSTRALNRAIAGTLDSRREAEAARKTAREAALASDREREKYEQNRQELQRSQEAFARWTVWVNGLKPGDEVHLRILNRSAKVVRMQLHRQTALVTAGAMDIEVSLRDLNMPLAEG